MTKESKTFKQTTILGVYFLLMLTTYSSFSHIVSYIVEHSDDLYSYEAEVVLILNYVVYLMGLTRAPSITNYKKQFLIAAICYSLNYGLYLFHLNYFLALLISMIGAVAGGFGASVLWVSQGGYMVKLFKKYEIQKDHQGFYLGILNALVYGSSLLGAIIITFGLGLFGNQIYFLILTLLGISAFLICYFLLDSLEGEQEEQIQKKNSFSWSQLLQNFKSVYRFLPIMKDLIAALMLDGLMLGFVAAYFSHLVPVQIRNSINVGIVLLINGFGAIIGGYLSGYLSDKLPPPRLGISGFLFMIITLLLTFLTKFVNFETLVYPSIIGLLWGICLYFLQGWIFVCCTKIYEGKIQSFAIAKQIHTFSFIIFQIYMIICKNEINLVGYLILLIILSIISIYSCQQMNIINKQKIDQELVEEASPPQQ